MDPLNANNGEIQKHDNHIDVNTYYKTRPK